jgi:GAF domain-containing protein
MDQTLVAQTMVQLADTLVSDFDLVDLLTGLADRCVETLAVSAAGVMLAGPGGELRAIASSSEAMRMLELFELQADEGPCLDCFATGTAVAYQELATAVDRWPRFASKAMSAGFAAVQALPMHHGDTVVGALNLFHLTPGVMRAIDIATAQAFADVATIAILQHRLATETQLVNDQLNSALTTRIVIEQAKGMVAERRGIDMERAFATLREHARDHNLRLAEVCGDVVDGWLAAAALGTPRPPRTAR